MEPARVPQHLEMEDVLAWGMTATDLLWLGGGLVASWWIYLHLPGLPPLRLALSLPSAAVGALLGPARIGGRPLRALGSDLVAFWSRPRRLLFGGGR